MFLPRTRPLRAREEQLRSLRLSLNSPELAAGELPAGPARAAVVLHHEADTDLALSVVVQSLGSGTRVVWTWEGAVAGEAGTRAIEAALSFGESMGFLFDEDALVGEDAAARRRALDHWWELVGWPAADASAEGAPRTEGDGLGVPAVELVDPDPAGDALPLVAAPAQRPAAGGLPLTKFRRRLGGPPPEPVPRPQAALGRLRLIRKRSKGAAGERPSFWLRLLGSF